MWNSFPEKLSKYSAIICPWWSPVLIKSQVKFAESVFNIFLQHFQFRQRINFLDHMQILLSDLWCFPRIKRQTSDDILSDSKWQRVQGQIQEFWKGVWAMRISGEGGPTMVGGDGRKFWKLDPLDWLKTHLRSVTLNYLSLQKFINILMK